MTSFMALNLQKFQPFLNLHFGLLPLCTMSIFFYEVGISLNIITLALGKEKARSGMQLKFFKDSHYILFELLFNRSAYPLFVRLNDANLFCIYCLLSSVLIKGGGGAVAPRCTSDNVFSVNGLISATFHGK